MNTQYDIKRLPALYTEKARLEAKIEEMGKKLAELKRLANTETSKAQKMYDNFDEMVKTYSKASENWWSNFYKQNSAEKTATRISQLEQSIREREERIRAANLIDNEQSRNDLKHARKEMDQIAYVTGALALAASDAAKTALCYNVCIYADTSGWCVKSLNKEADWGLHLCPNGIESSVFGTIYHVLNPLGYADIKAMAEKVPQAYKDMLEVQQKLITIRQKYNLTDDDPSEELSQRLEEAADTRQNALKQKEQLTGEKQKMQQLQKLVGNGLQYFMAQDFDEAPLPLSLKGLYQKQMSETIKQQANYSSLKDLCDSMVSNVFDYKKTDRFVSANRQRLQKTIENAPQEAEKQQKKVAGEMEQTKQKLHDIRAEISHLQDNYEALLLQMTQDDPMSTFFYQGKDWINSCDDEGNSLAVKRIREKAAERTVLKQLPAYEYLNLGGVEKPFISNADWQTGVDNAVNLLVKPLREDKNKPDAPLWAASNLITAILMAMPIRQVHFTFIDFRTDGIYSMLLSQLNAERNLYTVVHDTNQLSEIKKRYNERTQHPEKATEVVVWTGCISDEVYQVKDALSGMMQNGARYNYYMIAVPLDNMVSERAKNDAEEMLKAFQFRTIYAPGENFNNGRDIIIEKITEYVRKGADTKRATSVLQPSMERRQNNIFDQRPRHIANEGIMVPIGYDENNQQEVFYEFNVNRDLPHTFLLGGSGSGKSYLLQNILLNSMLTYHAEDLEFYLMDFKMGAAEFRFYQDMPHVSHLLIDDADHQAVFEILSELDRKMEERGRIIAEANAGSIVNYNELHPEKRLPYIVLVVDECHKLFESDSADHKMQERINRVIAHIVKEGRSQGVTFIFATQTFAGMEIPSEIKNEARNKYLMRVTTGDDANKLFEGGARINNELSQGYAYHEAKKTKIHIYDYAPFKEKAKQAILAKNERPAGRNNFIFSGKDEYALPETINNTRLYPIALIGKSVSVKREDMTVAMRKEAGRNLLITGINDDLQAERVFFSAVMSLAMQGVVNGKRIRISLFDNHGDEDDRYPQRAPIFRQMEEMESVRIIRSKRDRLQELARLGNVVRQENPDNEINILCLLGQEKMRSLLYSSLPQPEQNNTPATMPQADAAAQESNDLRSRLGFLPSHSASKPLMASSGSSMRQSSTTAEEELLYLLKEGGESHVHIIMQVNQPGNILADADRVHRNDLRQWFTNMAILKCPTDVQSKLPVNDVRLERLSAKPDMLRAISLDENGDTQMFTPYIMQR